MRGQIKSLLCVLGSAGIFLFPFLGFSQSSTDADVYYPLTQYPNKLCDPDHGGKTQTVRLKGHSYEICTRVEIFEPSHNHIKDECWNSVPDQIEKKKMRKQPYCHTSETEHKENGKYVLWDAWVFSLFDRYYVLRFRSGVLDTYESLNNEKWEQRGLEERQAYEAWMTKSVKKKVAAILAEL